MFCKASHSYLFLCKCQGFLQLSDVGKGGLIFNSLEAAAAAAAAPAPAADERPYRQSWIHKVNCFVALCR
jgi:hypothetical protein